MSLLDKRRPASDLQEPCDGWLGLWKFTQEIEPLPILQDRGGESLFAEASCPVE